MAVPTLDGLALFGDACTVSTAEAPRAGYASTQFGESGLGVLDGGGRGRVTTIVGTLAGQGPFGLAAAEGAVRSYQDGAAYLFVDSQGTPWPSVQLHRFRPAGRVRQSPAGLLLRDFHATLRHLE